MKLELDASTKKQLVSAVGENFAEAILPTIETFIEKKYLDDELLTKTDLCKRILHVDVGTADKYFVNKKGFPYIQVGKQKRYPKKAVMEWMANNTLYKD